MAGGFWNNLLGRADRARWFVFWMLLVMAATMLFWDAAQQILFFKLFGFQRPIMIVLAAVYISIAIDYKRQKV